MAKRSKSWQTLSDIVHFWEWKTTKKQMDSVELWLMRSDSLKKGQTSEIKGPSINYGKLPAVYILTPSHCTGANPSENKNRYCIKPLSMSYVVPNFMGNMNLDDF